MDNRSVIGHLRFIDGRVQVFFCGRSTLNVHLKEGHLKLIRSSRRRAVPTDLELLDKIFERHHADFAVTSAEGSVVYLPIDIEAIAEELGVDRNMVFGRLYFDLNKRFGYRQADGSQVAFFTPKAGAAANCVNFPYLASVVANLRDEDKISVCHTYGVRVPGYRSHLAADLSIF